MQNLKARRGTKKDQHHCGPKNNYAIYFPFCLVCSYFNYKFALHYTRHPLIRKNYLGGTDVICFCFASHFKDNHLVENSVSVITCAQTCCLCSWDAFEANKI